MSEMRRVRLCACDRYVVFMQRGGRIVFGHAEALRQVTPEEMRACPSRSLEELFDRVAVPWVNAMGGDCRVERLP